MIWSQEQLLQWRQIYGVYSADALSVARQHTANQQRRHVQQEILQVLHTFLAGESTLKEFNAIFQQKTHSTWNIFHIRGTSGGLFLNKLVKYIPDEEQLTQLLRLVLRLPKDTKEGEWRMQTFVHFLEGAIASRQVTRLQVQPARVAFFLSIWWHMQENEQWPISYPTVRSAIMGNEKKTKQENSSDPAESYFVFRAYFQALAHDLRISSWEAEHFLTWCNQEHAPTSSRGRKTPSSVKNDRKKVLPLTRSGKKPAQEVIQRPARSLIEKHVSSSREQLADSSRSSSQWLLAKLGQRIGCQVWIRSADHRKTWQGERLGTLSVPSLPILAESSLQQVIEQLDVVWLLNNEIVAAYQIEQPHADLSSGLLRLFDIGTLDSAKNARLCIIIQRDCFGKVSAELQRPLFQQQETWQRCTLISREVLQHHAEHVLRWARNLSVIDDLVSQSASESMYTLSSDQNSTGGDKQKERHGKPGKEKIFALSI